jgi:hypothetical protein
MDNGDGEHKLPVALMTQVMDGMDVGYGYFPD